MNDIHKRQKILTKKKEQRYFNGYYFCNLQTFKIHGVCSVSSVFFVAPKSASRGVCYQGVGKMVRDLWFRRKAIIKYKEEEEQNRRNNGPTPIGMSRSDPGPMWNCQTPIRWKSRGYSATRG